MRSLLVSAVVSMSALGLPPAAPSAAQADEKPATMRVLLPDDATLAINGASTQSTSAVRTFITPPLREGKDFRYDVRAQVVRNGATVTIERQVMVRAGRESVVDLNVPAAPEDRAFYYSPAAPASVPPLAGPPAVLAAPDLPAVRGYVGGARDNWKPDFSDPFLISSGW